MSPAEQAWLSEQLQRHTELLEAALASRRPAWREWVAPAVAVIGVTAAAGMFVFKTNIEAEREHRALQVVDVQLDGRVSALETEAVR